MIARRACESTADLLIAFHSQLLTSREERHLNFCDTAKILTITNLFFSPKIPWAKSHRSVGVIQSISVSSFAKEGVPLKHQELGSSRL